MKPETLAIHAPNRRWNGAVAPPIHMTTTYEHGADASELTHGYLYVRHDNPNVSDLEARLAALEGGAGAVAYASGMGAAAAILATLKPGDRAIFHYDLYFDIKTLAREELPQKNITAEFIDFTDRNAVEEALSKPASMVWFETPSNPQIDLIDIAFVAGLAKKAGAKTVVDGTFATPALQLPLNLGADYVMHAATKYMGGHSDVMGGAVIAKDEKAADDLKHMRTLSGGVLSPFNAWLIARGLQTLHCRMERHCANAQAIAEFLEGHKAIEKTRYPGLPSNPDYALAKEQMRAPGGMLSFDVKGGREAAFAVASNLRLIVNATSLGGVESLIEHRASLEGADTKTPQGLLRLAVGLEHIDDLLADLEQALDAV